MKETAEGLFARIERIQDQLRPSERRLAQLVLSDPIKTVDMTMDEIASKAKVSAPTVARFCAAVGCSGFRAFKIRLAQDRTFDFPVVHPDVQKDDSLTVIADKVFARTLNELLAAHRAVPYAALEQAAHLLAESQRIEFYGSGNSGIVATDLQHKFFRLGCPTVAYSDPHVFCMSALTLHVSDAVVLVSNSGCNRDIQEAAENAKSVGARTVAITDPQSPLARIADIVVPSYVHENADFYSPMTSRIMHLILGDILCVAVAQCKGEKVFTNLLRSKEAVRRRRS